MIEAARRQTIKRVVVVNGVDENTIEGLNEAVKIGFVSPILTGDRAVILKALENLGIDAAKYRIVHAADARDAAEKAIELVVNGEADLVMKGLISTDKFMKVLLKKENGMIPSNSTLFHISVMHNVNYH